MSKKNMLNIKYNLQRDTPRWIVLCIDLYLVFNAFVLAYFIRFNFSLSFSKTQALAQSIVVIFAYLYSFYVFKSYKGIIKRTGFNDANKVFFSCLLASILLIAFSALLMALGKFGYLVLPYSIIIIHLFISIVMLVFSRILYKELYMRYVIATKYNRRALIYGAGTSGIITCKAIENDNRSKTTIIGYIDDNSSKIGKSIDGLKVYSSRQINQNFIDKRKVHEIIISIQDISAHRLREISEELTDLSVRLKIVPSTDKWLNGDLNAKQIKQLKIEDLLGRETIRLKNQSVEEQINGKVVLITGAAGSIGSEIARQIALMQYEKLILIDHAESALYDLQQGFFYKKDNQCSFIVGNVRDKKRMNLLFEEYKPEIVFHAAAYKHVPLMEDNPYESVTTNILGTKIIADLSSLYKAEKFIMISTDKAVNPTNVMGATKRVAEIYVNYLDKKYATNFIVTRFGNVLGSNGSVIPLFRRQIEAGGPLTVTHKDITRFFMTIPEACQLVLEAATMGNGGEIFVFDMGESMKIFDLAKRMIRLSGLRYPEDIDIEIIGLRPGEKIFEELLANDENTVKTHHPKIMIAKVRAEESLYLEEQIEKLCHLALNSIEKEENDSLVKRIKEIVPEYVSQNSKYEKFDT